MVKLPSLIVAKALIYKPDGSEHGMKWSKANSRTDVHYLSLHLLFKYLATDLQIKIERSAFLAVKHKPQRKEGRKGNKINL